MERFFELNRASVFRTDLQSILEDKLKTFFSAKVTLIDTFNELSEEIKKSINKVPKRPSYFIDENHILIVARVSRKDVIISLLGIILERRGIGLIQKMKKEGHIFSAVSNSISYGLSMAYKKGFGESIQYLDDNMIRRSVAFFLSKRYLDISKMLFLMDYFVALRPVTFEGNHFSTGLILTSSNDSYRDAQNCGARNGLVRELERSYSLPLNNVSRRNWYLVDGDKNFYLCKSDLSVNSLFTFTIEEEDIFTNNLKCKRFLLGSDVLFRTENGKELSIITADNIEFIFMENQWKFRVYKNIRELVYTYLKDDEFYVSLLYYVIRFSKTNRSSIIWIPDDVEAVTEVLKVYYKLLKEETINIKDKNNAELITRLFSSDGATILDKSGNILYYGCIVNLDKMTENADGSPHGTGESAAKVLSINGIAFKISQDGTIKLFIDPDGDAIII